MKPWEDPERPWIREPAPHFGDPNREEWLRKNKEKNIAACRERAKERAKLRRIEGGKKQSYARRTNNWSNRMSKKKFEEQLRENHKELLKLLRTVTIPVNVTLPDPDDVDTQKDAMKQLMYIDKLMTVISKFGKIVAKVEQASDEYEDIAEIVNKEVIEQGREYLKLVNKKAS